MASGVHSAQNLSNGSIRLKARLDLAEAALTPEEGFLLSRLDAATTLRDLVLASGLGAARVEALVASLLDKGVLEAGPGDGGAASGGGSASEGARVEDARYPGFIFNPADLAEEVDLDVDLRKEILFRHAHLKTWDHYEVLGVEPDADPEVIRHAWFGLTRRFHPDRYYGRTLGRYADRLSAIFQRLVAAQEVLTDPERRRAYDRSDALSPAHRARAAAAERQEEGDERRARERRDRLLRRTPVGRRKAKARSLGEEARRALSEGDPASAARLFKLAASYDPADAAWCREAEKAEEAACEALAQSLQARAATAEALGQTREAEAHLCEAAKRSPRCSHCHLELARFLMRADANPALAVSAARRAADLSPEDVDAWTVLGRLLLAEGRKREGREALERAVALDPKAHEARTALRKSRWSPFS